MCRIYLPDVYKQVITSILTEICTMPRSDRQGFFHAPMMPSLKAAGNFNLLENFGDLWHYRANFKIFNFKSDLQFCPISTAVNFVTLENEIK